MSDTPKEPNFDDVARWLLDQITSERLVYQETVVYEIKSKFGDAFVDTNDNGNLVVSRKVLTKFRKISPDVVWDRGDRCWRVRESRDNASRQQD